MNPAKLARGHTADLLPLFGAGELRGATCRAVATIILGSGCYGFTVGLWRGSEMALYVAVKTPALLFLTLLVTGFLNGLLGLVLGSGIGFRQSILCQLLAFSLASVVLASLAPITLFLALEAPAADSPEARRAHSYYLLIHTAIIALGGLLAVTRLFGLIRALTPDFAAARVTLLSWLASNAFVGAQLSYLLRPFFGSPALEIAFLREDAFNGTFYEAVWHALTSLLPGPFALSAVFLAIAGGGLLLRSILFPNESTTIQS